jgi:hypothetical protein
MDLEGSRHGQIEEMGNEQPHKDQSGVSKSIRSQLLPDVSRERYC